MANKVGRPTKYKPEYCDMIIEHMQEGYSIESFAGVAHVSKSTLYEWIENFPEFSDAVKEGVEQSRLFWERKGIEGLFNKSISGEGSISFNTANWIFQMKNRFKDEWRDKQEIDQKVEFTDFKISDVIKFDDGKDPE